MKGIYVRSDSPYYWLRYYDKLEQDPAKKRKSLVTKIEVTPADRKRYQESKQKKLKPKYQGNSDLREFTNGFKRGLNEKYIGVKTGVKILRDLTLSEGYAEFKKARTVPGMKKQLKDKTLLGYDHAVDHMIKACTDKKIYKYTDKDYEKLLFYFDELKVPAGRKKNKEGELETIYKQLSINTRSIYTRSLRSLWNYFIGKNYAAKNIILPLDEEEKDPDPIPHEEMYSIIQYFKEDEDYPHHYWIIYFMLLTGCRPSSAMVQLKEDIFIKRKVIRIRNVKSERKKKKAYLFPLYSELKKLLVEDMGVKEGDSGRLFHMYKEVPALYTSPLSFWERAMKFLTKAKKISRPYKLKQLRPTFFSFLINVLKMKIYTVYKLADHADIKITDKHYVDFKLDSVRRELDDFSMEDYLTTEEEKP
jgi:integrase